MVQLNPLKWGSKKRAEKLKIEKLNKTISSSGMGRGVSKRKSDALKELNKMGHLTDKQQAQKDKEAAKLAAKNERIARDNKRNSRRGTGFNDKSTSTSTSSKSSKSTSKSTATMTGKERAQQMARDRIAAKKAGTYKKPKTAQELAKERLAKKAKNNQPTKTRGRVR